MLTNLGFSIVSGHILGTALAIRRFRAILKAEIPDDAKKIIAKACDETTLVIIFCTILTVGTWILVHKLWPTPI